MASIIVVATSLSKIIIIIALIDDKINNINKKKSDIDIYIYISMVPPHIPIFLFSYSNLFYNIDRIPLSIIPIVLPYTVSKLYDRAPTFNPKILRPLMVFAS